jgi:hypothetical protein
MNDAAEPQPVLQRDVQRLLGRCMLRIQQYEKLMKALLAGHELTGPAASLETQHSAREAKFSDRSLGLLVEALFKAYVVPDGFEKELLPDAKAPSDRISMAFAFRRSMSLELWNETKAEVEDLVALRNELVHHLIERFDLWADDGCVDAKLYLEEAYRRVDQHYGELAAWAESEDEARGQFLQFVQSPAFQDMLVNGIAPDGTFDWPSTGIVRALRDAGRLNATNGWVRLNDALAWIAEAHEEQRPEKYGCRTWPQVLHESRQFDLQYRVDADGSKAAWFRERVGS